MEAQLLIIHAKGAPFRSDGFAEGYIGCLIRLVFKRLGDRIPVTTSEVTDVRVTGLAGGHPHSRHPQDLPAARGCRMRVPHFVGATEFL